jgi:hypothetical protein
VTRRERPNQSAIEYSDTGPLPAIFLTMVQLGLTEDPAQGRHGGIEFMDRFMFALMAEHEFMRDFGGKQCPAHSVAVSAALPLVCNHPTPRAGGIAVEQVRNFLECQPYLGH